MSGSARVPSEGLPSWEAPDPATPEGPPIPGGVEVRVLEQRGDWSLVLAPDGSTGWVDGRRLEVSAAPAPPPAPPPVTAPMAAVPAAAAPGAPSANRRNLVIAAVAVVAVVVLGFVFLGGGGGDDEDDDRGVVASGGNSGNDDDDEDESAAVATGPLHVVLDAPEGWTTEIEDAGLYAVENEEDLEGDDTITGGVVAAFYGIGADASPAELFEEVDDESFAIVDGPTDIEVDGQPAVITVFEIDDHVEANIVVSPANSVPLFVIYAAPADEWDEMFDVLRDVLRFESSGGLELPSASEGFEPPDEDEGDDDEAEESIEDDEASEDEDDEVSTGSASVVVTLRWEGQADLDLMVTEPSGDYLDYSSETSPSGGRWTDLDPFECTADATGAEEVVWDSSAPPGDYDVVPKWIIDDCESGEPARYELVVEVDGEIVLEESGDFFYDGGTYGEEHSFTVD